MTVLEAVVEHWEIITSLVTVGVVGWRVSMRSTERYTENKLRTESLELRMHKVESQLEAMNPILIEIRENLASLNTASDFIKVQIAALNDKVNRS